MNRLVKILLLIPVIYLLLMPVYYAHTTYSKPCRGIKINIKDSADFNLVTKKEILNSIYSGNSKILGKQVKEIPVADIENSVAKMRDLRFAEIYMSVDGLLHVYADQRTPVMRVMAKNGGDYYLDVDGVVFRRRNLYTPRLHIVGGNVNITSRMLEGVSILDTSIKNTILKDIFYLVNYINDDNFWSAQIDQVFVDGNDEIDLVPRVGNHIIHLGTAENFEGKLESLRTFYDKVLPEVGWNKYSVINLAYRDQIVCRKR